MGKGPSLPRKVLSWYFKFCAKTSRAISKFELKDEIYNADYSNIPTIIRSTCRLDRLKFKIHGVGMVSIWDTPHYAFITGCDQVNRYRQYIEEHYGLDEVQPSINRFQSLETHLSQFPHRKVLLTRSVFPYSKWLRVLDGTHRAAYVAFQGDQYVEVVLAVL